MNHCSVIQVRNEITPTNKEQTPDTRYLSDSPTPKSYPCDELDEEQQNNGNIVSILKSFKVEKKTKTKLKEKEDAVWIIIIYLVLMSLFVIGVCKAPVFGLSTRATFWIVNALGVAIILAIFLYQKLINFEQMENSCRVSFAPKAEICYL